jgi:hypothetical protein
MKYLVRRLSIGSRDFLEITKEQFIEIKKAVEALIEAVSIEEKFNILCKNYFEFERELLEIRLRNTMFSDKDEEDFLEEIYDIERRIVNLLTTSRLYLDQLRHTVSSVYGSAALATLNTEISAVYDSSFGYRVVEAIRNWVQHRGLVVSSLQLQAAVIKADKTIRSTITPSLSLKRIKEVGEFKTSILAELESLGNDTFDLKPIIREAMEGYARVHEFVRTSWSDDVDVWEKAISDIRKEFMNRFGEGEFALTACELDDTGVTKQSVLILGNLIQRRRSLKERNRTNIRYTSQVVSNESAIRSP